MVAPPRPRIVRTDAEYPTLIYELQAMAAAGLVSLEIDSRGEMRAAALPGRAPRGLSLLERMEELHAAGVEELYA
jgi:hypothetical protein